MSHKYHAVGCREQYRDCPTGHASLKEHRRYQELMLMERAGEIRDVRQQVRLNLCESVNGSCRHQRPIVYVCDFVYERHDNDGPGGLCWHTVYEDSKGMETPVFKLKRHLLADQGIEVRLS